MSVNADSFRQALSRFASGVTVVTGVNSMGRLVGVTVSAFSSVSLSPPLILACLDRATKQLEAYTNGHGFAVNILAEDQAAVSDTFAFPGPSSPFDTVVYDITDIGVPVLQDTIASLVCENHAVHDGGDHVIIVGHVLQTSWRAEKSPLMYAQGTYTELAKTPA